LVCDGFDGSGSPEAPELSSPRAFRFLLRFRNRSVKGSIRPWSAARGDQPASADPWLFLSSRFFVI